MQRDNPSRTRLVNAIRMLVEKWEGQVEEGRGQNPYHTKNRVIFYGLEYIRSYLEQFTLYCAKTISETCRRTVASSVVSR